MSLQKNMAMNYRAISRHALSQAKEECTMRKIVCMMMAATLAIGMNAVTFAADYRAEAQVENLGYAYKSEVATDKVVNMGTISPDDKATANFPLVYEMFEADAPEGKAGSDALSEADMRTAGIEVKRKDVKGADAVKSVALDKKNGAVVVIFADSMVKAEDLDFEVAIYLVVNGKRYDDMGLTIKGTLANKFEEVYADDDFVDLSDGKVVLAVDRVQKIEVYLGSGVSVFASFTKDKHYSGTATTKPDADDDDILSKYSDIVDVVNVKVSGIKADGNVVKIDADYDFYVYDGNMKYIGRASEMLPLATKYYLAQKELDVKAADDGNDEPDTSKADETSKPVLNDAEPGFEGNPDTGDSNFKMIAAVLAGVALVVICVVVARRPKKRT